MNIGSTSDDGKRSNETPNPLRDQTPSQLTVKDKSPSPVEEKKEEKKFKTTFPMSNSDMLEHLSKYLNKYEQKEILKYPTVYFFNILERKLGQTMKAQEEDSLSGNYEGTKGSHADS